MVYISADEFHAHYEEVVSAARSGGSLVIFVAPDTDALCACQILTSLLQLDNIKYTVKPVSGYGDIAEASKELVFYNTEIKAVWFLNCGGTVDIYRQLIIAADSKEEALPYETKLVIVDSHYPIDLWNIDTSAENVVVFGEEPLNVDALPAPIEPDSEDEESYSTDEDEMTDSESTGQYRPRRRRRRADGQNPEMRQRRRAIRDYYRHSYFGPSAAHLVYTLATQCSGAGERNDFLWWAIIGLTDQYLHQRIHPDKYAVNVMLYRDAVQRTHAEDAAEDTIEITDATTGAKSKMKKAHHHRIQFTNELAFMLYRHWDLYHSIMHTDSITARLRTWTATGKMEVERFLAKMGIPLSESKQRYESMSHSHKASLKDRVLEFQEQFHLDDLLYDSFTQSHGFTQVMSAADVVFAVSALMEAPEATSWEQNFYKAYDALTSNGTAQLQEGLRLARVLQEHVVRQGTQLHAKQAIRSSGPFRFTYVTEAGDSKLFIQPVALLRLALFLVAILREHPGLQPKPLVVAAKDHAAGTYLVVGVNHTSKFGEVEKNTFAHEFKQSVKRANARVRYDGFDSAVIEVKEEDMDSFLENLHARA